MFEKELAYFIAHQSELVAKFKGKVLLLKGEEVIGAFDDALTAFIEGSKKFAAGTFMLQPCAEGPAAYTVTVHSSLRA